LDHCKLVGRPVSGGESPWTWLGLPGGDADTGEDLLANAGAGLVGIDSCPGNATSVFHPVRQVSTGFDDVDASALLTPEFQRFAITWFITFLPPRMWPARSGISCVLA
jgi:hypothetical protein